MTWLKLDDTFPRHRKVRRLTDAQFRLHVTALVACANDETDGRLSPGDIDDLEHSRRLRQHIPALVKAGLWEVDGDGWLIHDYLDFNPSHEELESGREANRKRQAALREKRRNAVSNAVTNAVVTRESRDPVPSRPVPSRPKDASSDASAAPAAARRKPERAIPDDWQPTDKHEQQAHALGVDVDREAYRFRNHAQANDRRARDWDAAFRNWLDHARPATKPEGRTRVSNGGADYLDRW